MTSRLFYVGGASGAGKSYSTRQIGQALGVPVLELDEIYKNLERELSDEDQRRRVMKASASALIRELCRGRWAGIVEGGWLECSEALALLRDYPEHFAAAFCGYASDSPLQRMELIKASSEFHWLQTKSDSEMFDWLESQIGGSAAYQRECARDLPGSYVDFSDAAAGCAALRKRVTDHLLRSGVS